MAPEIRWCLDSDDDGHWYIIPVDKRGEWSTFVEDPERYGYEAPDWAISVNGHPSLVTFLDPRSR